MGWFCHSSSLKVFHLNLKREYTMSQQTEGYETEPSAAGRRLRGKLKKWLRRHPRVRVDTETLFETLFRIDLLFWDMTYDANV